MRALGGWKIFFVQIISDFRFFSWKYWQIFLFAYLPAKFQGWTLLNNILGQCFYSFILFIRSWLKSVFSCENFLFRHGIRKVGEGQSTICELKLVLVYFSCIVNKIRMFLDYLIHYLVFIQIQSHYIGNQLEYLSAEVATGLETS